jgi:cysteine-rich repeat protein
MRTLKCMLYASLLALPLASCGLGSEMARSIDRTSENGDDDDDQSECVFTQGYWKNHAEAWPVDTLTLGTVSYTQDELLAILRTPVAGNGLIQLSHQLIAAKLNIANSGSISIEGAIGDADALIGDLVVPPVGEGHLATRETSALAGELDGYNNNATCGDQASCGDGVVDAGEQCDDGNTVDRDGCSATCTIESVSVCGDGHKDGAEQCDDGNTVDGDGCSARCTTESVPACGDGHKDDAEQCDDGNTVDGDGCSAKCTKEPVCGDGHMEGAEECDDGNTVDGDGCTSACVCE